MLIKQGAISVGEEESRILVNRLNRPIARVALGQALVDVASSAIDISDGLAADLGHILDASGVGAEIDLSAIPLSQSFGAGRSALLDFFSNSDKMFLTNSPDIEFAMTSGDDYELCFTVPAEKQALLESIADTADVQLSLIGKITSEQGLFVYDGDGIRSEYKPSGYQHF